MAKLYKQNYLKQIKNEKSMSKKIKSTTLTKYDYLAKNIHAEEIEVKGWKYSYTEFDDKGNTTLEIKYDLNGKVEDKTKNKYDKHGYLVEEVTYLDGREIAEHKTYERDAEGNIIKAFKHYNDGTKDTIEYEYNPDGELIKKTIIDSYGEVEAIETFKFKNGNIILNEKYEYDELMSKDIFVYDEKGNITENEKWTEDDGSVKFKSFYNENNNMVKELIYNKDEKLVAKSEYSYNNNNKITEVVEETPHGTNITKIKYDDKGNAIAQVEINKAGEVNNSVERKFNENNDVIETKVFIDFHGRDINQEYVLKYEYKYFE